jgi:hypothetical protein
MDGMILCDTFPLRSAAVNRTWRFYGRRSGLCSSLVALTKNINVIACSLSFDQITFDFASGCSDRSAREGDTML